MKKHDLHKNVGQEGKIWKKVILLAKMAWHIIKIL